MPANRGQSMIGYYLKEAFKTFKRAKLASLVTITTTAIAIVFVSASIAMVFLSGVVSEKLKDRIEINLFLNDSLSSGQIDSLKDEILKDPMIKSVKFIGKDEARAQFIKETGEDFKGILDVNPLPASFVVKFKTGVLDDTNISAVTSRYKSIKGVDDVVFDYSTVTRILSIIHSSRLFVYLGSIILVILSVYLVYSNNKLQLHARIEQINTMKLVGARISTIKIPLILNGAMIGIIASAICIVIYSLILFLLTKIYNNLKLTELFYLFDFLIILIGFVLGIMGSYISTKGISLKVEDL